MVIFKRQNINKEHLSKVTSIMKKRKNAVRKREKKTKAILAGGIEKWWHVAVQVRRAGGHNVVLDDVEENQGALSLGATAMLD